VKEVGGAVSAPTVIHSVPPEYTPEARKAKVEGIVAVMLIVDEHGLPQDVQVVRGTGTGLDMKAVEAIRQYRFKPALEDGRPVRVRLNIEVNFKIF
jgi:protein TonB